MSDQIGSLRETEKSQLIMGWLFLLNAPLGPLDLTLAKREGRGLFRFWSEGEQAVEERSITP